MFEIIVNSDADVFAGMLFFSSDRFFALFVNVFVISSVMLYMLKYSKNDTGLVYSLLSSALYMIPNKLEKMLSLSVLKGGAGY